MTAKDYLLQQLNDECPEACSVQTRTALAAYAQRIHRSVDGYSISELEDLIRSLEFKDDFVKKCIDFVSYSETYLTMSERVPSFVED
ncbi:MAG: hypothetical protein IJM43_11040 [Bacteroidaceae bacterium]|nr:hypothetical protein [Bacteroidaceae bacterium]